MENLEMIRGNYNEIPLFKLPISQKEMVLDLFNSACKSEKIDEHGNWEFGSEFDKKGRGYSIKWDLYGIGEDLHNKEPLIIIQIRKWEKRYKNGYANIRKSYFLIGKNEDKTVFAHPIESRVIHSAIKNGKNIIKSVQDWIFDCDYNKVLRQGDIALIPIKKQDGITISKTDVLIEKSHKLMADEICVKNFVYAKNPAMIHIPSTHPEIKPQKGWFKIIIGKRSKYYDFAAPTID